MAGAVWFNGQLDVGAFVRSVNSIIRRHEVLRTTFPTDEGEPTQQVAPELGISVPVIDLRSLPEQDRHLKFEALSTEEAQRPFDLEVGPLLRMTLLRMADDEFVCLFSMHHIISDQWSNDVFLRELATFYAAAVAGEALSLPDLSIQYGDYAYWQREWLQGDELTHQLDYWREHLEGVPTVLNLPLDKHRPPRQTFAGAKYQVTIPAGLHKSLKRLGLEMGATMFMTLLAAFQALLFRYTHQDRVNVGIPITNRDQASLTGLIGFFVNTLVMSVDLSDGPSFRQLLGRVKAGALQAYAHRDLPFEILVDELDLPRDLSHPPLFQVMFVLQNDPPRMPDLPGLRVTRYDVLDSGITRFDLILTLTESERGLSGWITYNTDLFNNETIQRMAQHYQVLLEGMVANPDRSIAGNG